MKRKILMVLLGVFILAIAGAGVGIYLYNKPHESILDENAAFVIGASDLATEYESNEAEANTKYLGKVVEVRGIIAEKLQDKKTGKYMVTLQGQDLSGVGCEFEPAAQNSLASLAEGQSITVKGICTGLLMDVVLVDCVLLPSNK